MDENRLYDTDVHAWAEQQSSALRTLAHSRRDLPNELDLEHIAEEIEDVGIAERNAAESYIRQIFVHLLKIACAPESHAARHWHAEIVTFHNDLLQRLTPSMHGRIDLEKLWNRAVKEAQARLEDHEGQSVMVLSKLRGPTVTIDDLAKEDFDLEAALEPLRSVINRA